jgi:hypothetical protein
MNFLKEIGNEIAAMFAGDLRLSVCILILVGGIAALTHTLAIDSLTAGAILLIGCLVILAGSVRAAAAGRKMD